MLFGCFSGPRSSLGANPGGARGELGPCSRRFDPCCHTVAGEVDDVDAIGRRTVERRAHHGANLRFGPPRILLRQLVVHGHALGLEHLPEHQAVFSRRLAEVAPVWLGYGCGCGSGSGFGSGFGSASGSMRSLPPAPPYDGPAMHTAREVARPPKLVGVKWSAFVRHAQTITNHRDGLSGMRRASACQRSPRTSGNPGAIYKEWVRHHLGPEPPSLPQTPHDSYNIYKARNFPRGSARRTRACYLVPYSSGVVSSQT